METQTLTTNHATYFNTFIAKLATKFQPLQIFSFSRNSYVQHNQGCFAAASDSHFFNYCLLLVTESGARLEHEVQDFANAHYQRGKIMVICHSKQAIDEAISANNRFFITVYTKAELVYNHNGMQLVDAVPTFIATHAAANARKHYEHRFPLSEGFYLGASECLRNWEQYSVCVFMLHQAVEQLCIGLIRVHLAYRSEFHNLNRLLQLCTCFSHAPLQLFTETAEDRRLFNILIKSYSAARYQANFAVSEKDAISLCDKVSEFTAMATRLCEEKIRELEQEVRKEVEV